MGNCLAVQPTRSEAITIMKMDGKMLTYESPIKVYQILEGFPGHVISDLLSMPQQLGLMSDMVPGRPYYMLPVEKKMDHGSVVRVKLVITKKELKEMLTKEVSLDEMVSLFQASDERKESDEDSARGWRPSLESIPEGC
jgi:PADRE domain